MHRMGWTDERMDDFARHTDQRFDAVDRRLDDFARQTDQRFDAVDRRLDQLDDRFAALQRTLVMTSGAIIAALIGLIGLIATQL
jgi:hypothetical protein